MPRNFDDYVAELDRDLSPEEAAQSAVFARAYTIAMAVHDARKRLGLTQKKLGKAAGVTQADISRIEHGRLIPSIGTLSRLTEALGGELTMNLPGAKSAVIAKAAPAAKPAGRPAHVKELLVSPRPTDKPTPGAIAAFHDGRTH
ncbi:MAG: helix-turn-helix domain-containing protein [Acidimicrobiales bacterium]